MRLVVAAAPGSAPDILARLIGQWLSERLGQPFVIDNRPGAGGNIGTEAVVKAAPDGYTLLLVGTQNAINATLFDKLNFNFIRDIAPVAGISRQSLVMVVDPSFPAKTVPEFIAYAKAKSRQDQHGVGGQRVLAPHGRRAVQDDGRGRHGSRTVSRRRVRAHRPARRTGAGDVRLNGRVDQVHQVRQASRAGCDNFEALGGVAGHSDRGRIRAGLRGDRVFWRRCAQEHAWRDY